MIPEISLSYANGRWRARGLGFALDVEHAELRALESLVEAELADDGTDRVAMCFDMDSLPAWMRQHQSHYFNYTLRVASTGGRS